MPRTTVTQNRQDSHKIASSLVEVEKVLKPLIVTKEDLKSQLREFGKQTYIIDGNVVTVLDPEVRTFVGRILVIDQTKALTLDKNTLDTLLGLGVLAWEDKYTRNAVARVETTLV